MASTDDPRTPTGREPGFWAPDRKNLLIGVLAGLIAAVIFALLGEAFAAFLNIKISTTAFQALLASALVTTIIVIVCFSMLVLEYRKIESVRTTMEKVSEHDSAIQEQFERLLPSIARIDWSYDAAELEGRVYERMQRMVEHPRIKKFKIVTIFRDVKRSDYSQAQQDAIRRYYSALESQVKRPGARFVYERAVLMRGPVGSPPSAQDLFEKLIPARPQFIEHYQKIHAIGPASLGNRASIKIYGAHGRLVDVAFAVALDNQDEPLTLVLEIGVTGPPKSPGEAPRRALGLLAFENPDRVLTEVLLRAHESIYEGFTTDIELVPEETVKRILLGST